MIKRRPMQPLRKGRYLARLAETPGDLHAAQRLRWLCFVARSGAADDGGGDGSRGQAVLAAIPKIPRIAMPNTNA